MIQETTRQKTHDGVDAIMDKVDTMNTQRIAEMNRLKEKVIATRENIDGYIRKNPEKSVLIAAGIGVIAGALIAAALMKKR